MQEIKIEIPSLSDNIRIVESFIDNAKDRFNIDDDIYGNIMVAVTESVNNAIIHGNKSDAEKNVELKLISDEDKLEFVVRDEGEGFDFEELPDPTAPENLERAGGRGIFLMKHLCDEVKFSDDGRQVNLVFFF